MGQLFDLEYDLLMYDITSTYFEGQANFDLAQRGYSRDQRSDCKQVCIGLVVSRCGMPLGYEVFAGNTADVTTVEHIVETWKHAMEKVIASGSWIAAWSVKPISTSYGKGGPSLHCRHTEIDAENVRSRTAQGRLEHDS